MNKQVKMIIRTIANAIPRDKLQSGIKFCVYNFGNVKFLLLGIFALLSCPFLHAGEQSAQAKIFLSNSSKFIRIAKNAKIYGKEHFVVKPNTTTPQASVKNATKTKSKTAEPVKNKVEKEEEPLVVVFPDFPFRPSSSFYLNIGNESSAIISQEKFSGPLSACKTNRENTYQDIEYYGFSLYLSEQRQKLPSTATQWGILTSFSPNSPSDLSTEA